MNSDESNEIHRHIRNAGGLGVMLLPETLAARWGISLSKAHQIMPAIAEDLESLLIERAWEILQDWEEELRHEYDAPRVDIPEGPCHICGGQDCGDA